MAGLLCFSVAAAALPNGWSGADIGSPGVAGSASLDGGTGVWTVAGGGADIWAQSDQFFLASREVPADGEIRARVTGIQATGTYAKAGVMIRSGLESDAGYAYVFVTPTAIGFECRKGKGAVSYSVATAGGSVPKWVKVMRSGGRYSGYHSSDGVNWSRLGTAQTLAIPAEARAGLAVCANNNAALNTGTFSDVEWEISASSRVSLSKFQSVSADSALPGSGASLATDGRLRPDSAWRSASGGGGHWVIVELPEAREVGSVQLFLGDGDTGAISAFGLHYDDGTGMRPIPGAEYSGNTATVINRVLANPVTAERVMLYTSDLSAVVREISLLPPNGGDGWPTGTDVSTNLARHCLVTGTSVDGENHAKLAVDGYAGGDAAWRSAAGGGPHTLTVELNASMRLGSAQVFTGSPGVAAAANFRLQYWNGATWLDVPGGVVSGNTEKDRRVSFSSVVETSRMLLLLPDNGQQTVRELALYPASTGAVLFNDVSPNAAPETKVTDFGDDWWTLENRQSVEKLAVTSDGIEEARPFTPEAEGQFQFLYNVGSDTFRIRNRATGSFLRADSGGAAVTAGNYSALPEQLWRLVDRGDGFTQIVNVANGNALAEDGAVLSPPDTGWPQQWSIAFSSAFPRKGIADYGWDWEKVRGSWNYNWSIDPFGPLPPETAHSPMQWGAANPESLTEHYGEWQAAGKPFALLGFNEPDFPGDAGGSDMSLEEALDLWPQLEAAELPLAAPAPAIIYGSWFTDFMAQAEARGYRMDYTAVHWYGNPDAQGLINHLQGIANHYGRPVWLTEFATTDFTNTATWTEEDNYRFLAEFLWMAEDLPWLKRYSVFPGYSDPPANPWDGTAPHCHIFNAAREYNAVGELYAAWDGDRGLRHGEPYLIHNKDASHRIGRQESGLRLDTIRAADSGLQWMAVPSGTVDRVHLVSLFDGARLSFDGSQLSFEGSSATGGSVEWRMTEETNGYWFIDHPQSDKRLRLNRTNDATGAPVGMWISLESTDTVDDSVRWRFIKPLEHASGSRLPEGWTGSDIGEPAFSGFGFLDSATGVWSLGGSGHDIADVSDQFYFASRDLTGDGEVIVKVADVQATSPYAKAGVMFRDGMDADAAYAFVFAGPGTVGFEARASGGDAMQGVAYTGGTAPVWLKLVRAGDEFRGFRSDDGVAWSALGSGVTLNIQPEANAGIAVTAHTNDALSHCRFTNVSVLPAPWSDAEIGPPPLPGGAVFHEAGDWWELLAGGDDVWGTGDEFHFVSQSLSGDGSVTAQVTEVEDTDTSAKAGVMIRGSGEVDAPFAFTFVTPSGSIYFQYRTSEGAAAGSSVPVNVSAPVFLRVERSGDAFRGFYSTDGFTWSQVGSSRVLAMEDSALAGLALNAHDSSRLNTSRFSGLKVAGGYAFFRQRHFTSAQQSDETVAGPLADANGDGVVNLLAYAQGLDPWTRASEENGGIPRVLFDVDYPAISYRRLTSASDILYTVEWSNDMQIWHSGSAHTTVTDIQTDGAGRERVTVRSIFRVMDLPGQFLRLRVEMPVN